MEHLSGENAPQKPEASPRVLLMGLPLIAVCVGGMLWVGLGAERKWFFFLSITVYLVLLLACRAYHASEEEENEDIHGKRDREKTVVIEAYGTSSGRPHLFIPQPFFLTEPYYEEGFQENALHGQSSLKVPPEKRRQIFAVLNENIEIV